MIIWIIGLSGSGKTKLSRELFKSKIISSNFISIDGDEFRRNISEDLGYSYRDRKKNAERISRFVAYLSKKNINIIVSVLSNYPKWLDWNKSNIKSYYQVYLKVDRQKLFSRNGLKPFNFIHHFHYLEIIQSICRWFLYMIKFKSNKK